MSSSSKLRVSGPAASTTKLSPRPNTGKTGRCRSTQAMFEQQVPIAEHQGGPDDGAGYPHSLKNLLHLPLAPELRQPRIRRNIGHIEVNNPAHARCRGGLDERPAILRRLLEGGPSLPEPNLVGVIEDTGAFRRPAQSLRVGKVQGISHHPRAEGVFSPSTTVADTG